MTAMNESLKRLHDMDKHGDKEAESASKRPRHLPEPGICSEVNDLLTEWQTAQDKNSNTTESQDDVLDGIAQSLNEAKRKAWKRKSLQTLSTKAGFTNLAITS